MDVKEVRKLDAYLKKLFGNTQIRVVPKSSDTAEIFVDADDLGELTVDEDEGERSYNFRMVIQVGNDPSIQPVPTLNAYLRSKFDNENIRVVPRPKKDDCADDKVNERPPAGPQCDTIGTSQPMRSSDFTTCAEGATLATR